MTKMRDKSIAKMFNLIFTKYKMYAIINIRRELWYTWQKGNMRFGTKALQ